VGGRACSWGEARRLVEQLATDPSSHLCASVNEWAHPLSREAALLVDLFDLTAAAHSGKRKPKPHPGRPWSSRKKERYGNTGGRSRAEVEALLRRARKGT